VLRPAPRPSCASGMDGRAGVRYITRSPEAQAGTATRHIERMCPFLEDIPGGGSEGRGARPPGVCVYIRARRTGRFPARARMYVAFLSTGERVESSPATYMQEWKKSVHSMLPQFKFAEIVLGLLSACLLPFLLTGPAKMSLPPDSIMINAMYLS
jgi:hypothetical protein